MKRSKFSEEQVVYALRQAEAGTQVSDLCRQLGADNALPHDEVLSTSIDS